jgi:sulfatase modifying factor 1
MRGYPVLALLALSSACGARTGLDVPDVDSESTVNLADAADSPSSCALGGEGVTGCGPAGESCCASLEVPGGTFFRTYVNSGRGPTGEADPATVSTFRLDKYDVTVGRFRGFVSAWKGGAGWLPPASSGKHTHLNGGQGLVNAGDDAGIAYETGWVAADDGNIAPTDANLACEGSFYDATWTPSVGNRESLPINCVNWYEAYAFCIWDGGFLPSETEWEYMAAGGTEQREFPWGSSPAPPTPPLPCNASQCILPVGSDPQEAARWGQLDMGSDYQWTLDWFAPYVDPCADCAGLTASTSQPPGRVMRGDALPPAREWMPPADRGLMVVRCARTP